jgi:quercetin dioxygenase-like cupin family protein
MDLHQIDWENVPWEPVREGITRKAFSGNGATVALHKLMPKHEPKPHAHSYEQIVYIIAGRIRFHVGEKSVMLGPGGLLQIPPDVLHWARWSATSRCSTSTSSPRCGRNTPRRRRLDG